MGGNAKKICPKCNINICLKKASGCKECWGKFIKGENHPRWKGGAERFLCADCKKPYSGSGKRCLDCLNKVYESTRLYCKDCGKKLGKTAGATKKETRGNYCQKCYKGKNNHSYNDKLTDEERLIRRTANPEYEQWRITVMKRDNYTCNKCGDNKGGNLNAHHIFNWRKYTENRFDEDNGVTLCVNCHIEFHRKYGYKNNDLTQLLHFLNTNTSNVGIFTNN